MRSEAALQTEGYGSTGSAADHGGSGKVDFSRASIARVYDAFLDGKDNYEVDRAVLAEVLKIAPNAKAMAKASRRFLTRAVRYIAEAGVDQFLDCGSGLPTVQNTHQIAQKVNPEAVVVYVDNDPVVSAFGRALLTENERTRFLEADLREPGQILSSPTVTDNLDFSRPIALMQVATFHHVDDDADPAGIMAEYVSALASGSYVVLSHFYDNEDGGEGTRLAHEIESRFRNSSMGTGRYRTRGEIEALLRGLEMVEPGLVEPDQWRPDGPTLVNPSLVERLILSGVARKP